MVSENQSGSDGIVLDTSLIAQSVRYYAIIGIGLGILGIFLILQLGGGDDLSSQVMSSILSVVVLSFAVLSGPIIAAFVGFATAKNGIGNIRARSVNSGIANGIGFAVFGVVVSVLLLTGLSIVAGGGDGGTSAGSSGGGGPVEIGKLVTLIVLMTIPNSVVGGAITFFLGGRGGASPQ